MIFTEVMERFVEQSPVSVMFRGTFENAATPELLDEVFANTAKRQRCSELLFSSVMDLLGLVVTGTRKSVNDAYRAKREQLTVSVTALYDKLQGVETEVSRQMVCQMASRMAQVVDRLNTRGRRLLCGYHVKIIDGNHLAATEHRIQELRTIGSGPLPGQALVVLEPDRMLMTDVFPCEDAHAQERRLLPQVLQTVQAGDLWIADRNFCTTGFLFGIAARRAKFLIRQHRQALRWGLLGTRRRIGRCPTGTIYEQKVRLTDEEGKGRIVRRITIKLKKPTRNGETEIHLLTNLPAKDANARAVAALLSFCVAILAYNVISAVKSALAAVHCAKAQRQSLSGYYLAGELSAAYHGMAIAVPAEEWTQHFGVLTASQLVPILKALAAKVPPDRFRKNVRGPKKPRPKRSSGKRHFHVSTARILAQRKPSTMHAVKA